MPKDFSCNLGSLNLSEFVRNPYTPNAYFDYGAFEDAIYIAVKALDNIIDENLDRHALTEQAQNSFNYRNIGLGVMGYANALFKLGLTYGSNMALDFTKELFGDLFYVALKASCNLAKEKGSFPKCKSKQIARSTIIKNIASKSLIEDIEEYGLRNCSLISIAPTGSIATMLGISGGCEPEFALSYTRKTDNLKDSYEVYCQSVNEYWDLTTDAIDRGNIDSLPKYFVTSSDIPWYDRIDTQAAMQRYVDTAISSTVNLPKNITLEEIEQIYLYAWQEGLKGITLFRNGCNRSGILVDKNNEDADGNEKLNNKKILPRGFVLEADEDVIGKKRKLMTGCGSLHCTAFFDPITGDLLETYLSKGSTGGCNNFMIGLSRMISLAARGGVPMEAIIDQLNSCGACPSYAVRSAKKKDTSKGACCPMAVGNAVKEMYDELQCELGLIDSDTDSSDDSDYAYVDVKKIITENKVDDEDDAYVVCEECGAPAVKEGGCVTCKACGYSPCG